MFLLIAGGKSQRPPAALIKSNNLHPLLQHFVSKRTKEQKDPEMFGSRKSDKSPSDRFFLIKVQRSDSFDKQINLVENNQHSGLISR